jgi:hypothetical protein
MENFIGNAEALRIVLDLAFQNVIDIKDDREEHLRQMRAIDMIENFLADHANLLDGAYPLDTSRAPS